MALETPTGIWDLDPLNPASSDDRSEGDDHIRNLKSSLQLTWPQVSSTVNATTNELNLLSGLSDNVQSKLDTLSAYATPQYASMYLVDATTESSSTTNYSKTVLFDTTGGATSQIVVAPVDGYLMPIRNGVYEMHASLCVSASAAATIKVAIFLDSTTSNAKSTVRVPAQGASNVSLMLQQTLSSSVQVTLLYSTLATTRLTPTNAQFTIRKIS